jgi:hypothetical protein
VGDRYRTGDDTLSDPAAALVWRGFERSLLAKVPDAGWVATTWEDLYPRHVWRRFLAGQGYAPADSRRLPAVFLKGVGAGP